MNPILEAARHQLGRAHAKAMQGYAVKADIDLLRALNLSRRMSPRLGQAIRTEAEAIVTTGGR